jgi:hypothetical protein
MKSESPTQMVGMLHDLAQGDWPELETTVTILVQVALDLAAREASYKGVPLEKAAVGDMVVRIGCGIRELLIKTEAWNSQVTEIAEKVAASNAALAELDAIVR